GDPIAAGMLGVIEVLVGKAVEVVELGSGSVNRAANADREGVACAIGGENDGGNGAADLFGDSVGSGIIDPGQQHAEFLATQPTDQIIAADGLTDGAGDLLQGPVAMVMAKAVVDALEVVGIDDQQGATGIGGPQTLEITDDRAGKGAA